MRSAAINPNAHPNQEFSDITHLGRKASNLALLHAAALGPRLPPTTVSTLVDDLDLLGAAIPGARQSRHEAKVATADQEAALRAGHARVKAVRDAVKKARATDEVKKAYGVGQPLNPALVRDVKSVLQLILDRATANPAEAASLGIVQKDLDAMTVAHQAITDADKLQGQKLSTAPLSTQDRNRTANRILAAVARIAGAGGLEFADDAKVLAEFAALKPASTKKKAGAKKITVKKVAVLATPAEPADATELLDKTG
jgi:hypothetical protein